MKPICHRLLLSILLSVALLTACRQGVEPADSFPSMEDTRPETTAMKGMELYSWQDKAGIWQFAILPGTNRQKTADEILEAALTLEEVKKAFGRLAVGEILFWNHPQTILDADKISLATPPGEIVSTLRAHAAVAEVQLVLDGE